MSDLKRYNVMLLRPDIDELRKMYGKNCTSEVLRGLIRAHLRAQERKHSGRVDGTLQPQSEGDVGRGTRHTDRGPTVETTPVEDEEDRGQDDLETKGE